MQTMAKHHPGLVRRGNMFHVRKRVPDAIRSILGKNEIHVSLETGDRSTALGKYWPVCTEIAQTFDKARQKLSSNQTISISVVQAKQFAKSWYERTFANLEDEAREFVSDEDEQEYLMELGEWYRIYRSRVDEVIQPFLQGDADKFLMKQGFSIQHDNETDQNELADHFDKSAAGYLKFLELIRRGHLFAIERQAAIINEDNIADPFFATSVLQPSRAASSGQMTDSISIGQLIEKYLLARDLGEDNRTHKDLLAAFRVLTDVVGNNVRLDALTYDSFSGVFQILKRLPPNFAKKKDWQDKSLKWIGEETKRSGGKTLSTVSINKYMSRISAMMDWAVDTGHVNKNYAGSNSLRAKSKPGESKKNARHPFSIEALNAIFQADVYTNPDVENPANYWVPLISLFSGMRMEEILQLSTEDVLEEEGVRYFRIHDEGENSTKNVNAIRNVPIHPMIWKLGFNSLIEVAKRQSNHRMFRDVERGKSSKKYSSIFSKRFAGFLIKIGMNSTKTVFHSFRHNFRDAGRNCQIPDDRILAIGGWATGTGAQANYGSGVNLAELNKAIEQVNYEGLDLSSIKIIDW